MANKDLIKKMMKSSNTPAAFGGKLMKTLSEANIQTHVWHLQTNSYAQHMALGGFYDCIVDLTDSLLEVYQGLHNVKVSGNMDIKIDSNYTSTKPTAYLNTLKGVMEEMYDHKYLDAGCVANVMDEIMALIDKTLYLLTLK